MSASLRWESSAVKAQLRLTSLRLGQLQEKKDSQGNITRRDIATLLQQHNVGLARAKAQKLMQEDALGDLLEVLEMHIGLVLEHFNEIEQNVSPSPVMVEAASSIIFAAPQIESKDLTIVRSLLMQQLGPDFARSASRNQDGHVAKSIVRTLSDPIPSVAALDDYLEKIAHNYGVQWSPEPRRQDMLNTLSEILDPESSPIVDLPKLRRLCSRGVPDEPSWLRPRVWKLLFGVLPILKASWQSEMHKQRESYYDLIRRLLDPFSALSSPSDPLASMDATLLDVSKRLSNMPSTLFSNLEDPPESSPLCPLDDKAPDELKISCARNLDIRLKILQDRDLQRMSFSVTPEIRLESEADSRPEISLSHPDSSPFDGRDGSTTLLSSRSYAAGNAHQKHSSALLRLLYSHASINPGNLSPHIPSLLIPLYSALNQEIESSDLAHVEADTFWLFEAVVGEFSELEDEEGGNIWMKKFSERLAWSDGDLSDSLQTKGLDPALPHYSYRWLAPLLTHTLPLPSVFLVWDALFSCQMRERNTNPKIDHLLDICTAMLIRARAALFRLGKGGRRSPSLWADENSTIPPSSPLRAWELGDAFLEGMSLLQLYPVEAAGGIDRILQTASDLGIRRQEEMRLAKGDKPSLGARLKVTMWKGFTNQVSSPEMSPVEPEKELSDDESPPDDGNDTETPPEEVNSTGLTSRFANTVWRGITNKTAMEAPASPVWPASQAASRSASPSLHQASLATNEADPSPQLALESQRSSGLWGYAEKLKESDTAATIAKVSSNWRAKAMLSSWGLTTRLPQEPGPSTPSNPTLSKPVVQGSGPRLDEGRRGSLPPMDRTGVYSPPALPLHFHSPRDSITVTGRWPVLSPPASPDGSSRSDSTFMKKTRNLQTSLVSLTRAQTPQPATKSAPRPLLLSTSSPITPPTDHLSRSATSSTSDRGEWADVMRMKGHLHRDSQSSISSLSPSDALSRPLKSGRTDWDSDTGGPSRLVPLNRRSVSPMAPSSRVYQSRPTSGSSSAVSSDQGLLSPPLSAHIDTEMMTGIGPSASLPIAVPSPSNGVGHAMNSERQQAPLVLSEGPLLKPSREEKVTRKKTPPSSQYQPSDTSDSSVVEIPSRSPRLRSKRYPVRPLNVDIQNMSGARPAVERKLSNPNSLAVEWPADDQDVVNTPRASSFNDHELGSVSPGLSRSLRRSRGVSAETQDRHRKISTEGHDRVRKTSQRARKVSADVKEVAKRRDSSAEEGDDEGYDDLLSAYESEGSHNSLLR